MNAMLSWYGSEGAVPNNTAPPVNPLQWQLPKEMLDKQQQLCTKIWIQLEGQANHIPKQISINRHIASLSYAFLEAVGFANIESSFTTQYQRGK